MGVFICDFGTHKHYDFEECHKYRVNGTKKEIEDFIEELKEEGNEILEGELKQVKEGRNEWSVFLHFAGIEQEENEENIS